MKIIISFVKVISIMLILVLVSNSYAGAPPPPVVEGCMSPDDGNPQWDKESFEGNPFIWRKFVSENGKFMVFSSPLYGTVCVDKVSGETVWTNTRYFSEGYISENGSTFVATGFGENRIYSPTATIWEGGVKITDLSLEDSVANEANSRAGVSHSRIRHVSFITKSNKVEISFNNSRKKVFDRKTGKFVESEDEGEPDTVISVLPESPTSGDVVTLFVSKQLSDPRYTANSKVTIKEKVINIDISMVLMSGSEARASQEKDAIRLPVRVGKLELGSYRVNVDGVYRFSFDVD